MPAAKSAICKHCACTIFSNSRHDPWHNETGSIYCTHQDNDSPEHEPVKDARRVAAGKKSKSKGKTFERLIVNKLREAGFDCERGWWQSAGGGRVPDVMLDGFWLELGHGDKMDPIKKLEQAEGYLQVESHIREGLIPVAITRRTNGPIVATMRLQDTTGTMGRLPSIRDLLTIPVSMDWSDFVKVARYYNTIQRRLALCSEVKKTVCFEQPLDPEDEEKS